jgi:hypothetical protein
MSCHAGAIFAGATPAGSAIGFVDDEESFRDSVSGLLCSAGYRILVFESGRLRDTTRLIPCVSVVSAATARSAITFLNKPYNGDALLDFDEFCEPPEHNRRFRFTGSYY